MKIRRRTAAHRAISACLLGCLAGGAAAAPAIGPADPESHERRVVDGVGREMRLPAAPSRLISLAPSVTGILTAIGMAPMLVGVSDFCHPPESESPPSRIGGLINPDLERIVSLRPDLAIATTSGNYLEDADRISALGIPVYTVDTPTVAAVIATIRRLGSLLGARGKGDRVADGMAARIAAVTSRIQGRGRPKVLFVVWGEPILAPGRGTFINDALALAGADSISKDAPSRWTELGLEEIVAAAPEVLITVPDNREFVEGLARDLRWATVPAVRDGRLHVVGNTIQQPGPGIAEGIEEVAAILHPVGAP